MRAEREQRSDPGPREAGSDSLREVPDSLAPAGLGFRDDGCVSAGDVGDGLDLDQELGLHQAVDD